MRMISQFLLTFLLNACWQVALLAAVAAVCGTMLRDASTRARHLLWIASLVLSFAIPVLTCSLFNNTLSFSPQSQVTVGIDPSGADALEISAADLSVTQPMLGQPIHLSVVWAAILLSVYGLFLALRLVRLLRRWRATAVILRASSPAALAPHSEAIIARCVRAYGIGEVRLLVSREAPVPMTFGILDPVVILPERLLVEGDADVLTSAIGHEFVHVARRDYLLNLIYELIYLPLSFHPGAALLRRRINQTRELRADELVAERLVDPDVYARSLVQLAGAALPPAGRAQPITVGIADADILEVRVMSLLTRSSQNRRANRFLVIAAVLLLVVPCVAAGALAVRFSIDPLDSQPAAQEPAQQDQEARERELKERKLRVEIQLLEKKLKSEAGSKSDEVRELQERQLKERVHQLKELIAANDPAYRAEREAKERVEREIQLARQAALVRMARISMDQAIQIATTQQNGKVLECSLTAEHWDAPGKLARESRVFYHVVISSGDETHPVTTHMLIDAADGTVFKTERSEGGNESREQQR